MSQTTFDPLPAVRAELKRQGVEPEWLLKGFHLMHQAMRNGRGGLLSLWLHHGIGSEIRNAVRAADAERCLTDQQLDDGLEGWLRAIVGGVAS